MYSDAQKMFLLCKRDVQPVGTDRIYLLQGKKKKSGGERHCEGCVLSMNTTK